jgi:hypothetical protein
VNETGTQLNGINLNIFPLFFAGNFSAPLGACSSGRTPWAVVSFSAAPRGRDGGVSAILVVHGEENIAAAAADPEMGFWMRVMIAIVSGKIIPDISFWPLQIAELETLNG